MSVTVTKLLPYVIIALFHPLSPHKSLHLVPQTPVLPDPLTVDLQFPSVFIHTSLSYTTATEPLNNQTSSHTDSTAASAKNQKSSNTKSAAKTPDYTCPNEIDEFDIFICKDCGGAVDSTTYLNNRDPNAKCAGVRLVIPFPFSSFPSLDIHHTKIGRRTTA